MLRDIMDKKRAEMALYAKNELQDAELFSKQENPFTVQTITIPLDKAREVGNPLTLNIPHRSIYVQDATDVNVTVSVQMQSRDSINSTFTIRKNDAWTNDSIIPQINLSWSAQAGKTITLVFFYNTEFRSGSQISVTGGGVLVSEGSSFSDANQTMVAATIKRIFPADSTRALGIVINNTGATIWVGGSTVSNTLGYPVAPNGVFEWRNTAALDGYSVAGGSIFVRTQTT